jgi:AcrR family transcriptional regulator
MNVRETRRAAALNSVADYMLRHGLALSSVRALAQAAGTSDRMLFYYFADKDDIVVSALQTVSARLAAVLADALPDGPRRPEHEVLVELAALMRGPTLRPYMRLFLELVTFAARGEEPYRTVAGRIADGFVGLVAAHIDVPAPAAHSAAARLIAMLDGAVLLDIVGREGLADLALAQAR